MLMSMPALVFAVFTTVAVALTLPVHAAVNLQYTTGNPRVLNCDADASTSAACDPDGYKLLLTVLAAPGMAGSCLIALLLILYFVGKYLCNCCGGRDQHPNCCCPNMSLPAKYSKADLLRPRIYAVAVFGLFLGGCVWGGLGATHLRTQVAAFRTTADDSVHALQDTARQIAPSLALVLANMSLLTGTATAASASLTNISQSSEAVADELQRMVDSTVVPLTDYFAKFVWSVYVIFVLLVVGAVVGLVAAFCHQRLYLPMVLVLFFGIIGGIGGWALYGATLVGERLLDDACGEVDAYVTGKSSVLMAATGCNGTVLGGLEVAVQGLGSALTQAGCARLWSMCFQTSLTALQNAAQGRPFDCAAASIVSISTCQAKTLAQLLQVRQSAAIWADSSVWAVSQEHGAVCQDSQFASSFSASTCTLEACASSCTASATNTTLSSFGAQAREVLADYQATQLVERTAQRVLQVSQVAQCRAVLDGVVPPLQWPCSTGTHAVYTVRQSAGFMALCSVLAMATYILGAKRFIPLNEALVPQYG